MLKKTLDSHQNLTRHFSSNHNIPTYGDKYKEAKKSCPSQDIKRPKKTPQSYITPRFLLFDVKNVQNCLQKDSNFASEGTQVKIRYKS